MSRRAGNPEWMKFLEVARVLKTDFTSVDLAEKMGLVAEAGGNTEARNKAVQRTAAWLVQLCDWGYIEKKKEGTVRGSSLRKMNLYEVTDFGMTCVPGSGKLAQLVDAVRAFQKARGGKNEAAAFAAMVKACDEVA